MIREGRAALVTSFGVFKYMAGYSLTQFVTIMQLYWLNTNLTDFQVEHLFAFKFFDFFVQFLYIDLALVTLVSVFFGYTPSCDRLAQTPPPTRLLSLASVLSVIGQLTIIGFFQVLCVYELVSYFVILFIFTSIVVHVSLHELAALVCSVCRPNWLGD